MKDDVDMSEVQSLLHNNILASRYVANMETFGFDSNERGRHQFHFKFTLSSVVVATESNSFSVAKLYI